MGWGARLITPVNHFSIRGVSAMDFAVTLLGSKHF